eukprot:5936272-Pyramimonas_sp.AAC.1
MRGLDASSSIPLFTAVGGSGHKGTPTVFEKLNPRSGALPKSAKLLKSLRRCHEERTTAVSSAKALGTLSGMVVWMIRRRLSLESANSNGERGHPWRTPRSKGILPNFWPFSARSQL